MKKSLAVRPRDQFGAIAAKLPTMATFKCEGTWRYTPDSKDNWISSRLRWQLWTLRCE